MAKRINSSGEKEMVKHMATVRGARAALKKEAANLGKDIDDKVTFALSQDRKIMKDMRSADRCKKC